MALIVKRLQKKLFSFLSLFFLLVSCTDDINFSQADDLRIQPEVASSILYFETPELLINLVRTGVFYQETFEFNAFSESFVEDRILDGFIAYELENTTSKPMRLTFEFLDSNNGVLDEEILTIDPQPIPKTEIQVAYGPGGKSLDILKNTTQIRVSATNLGDNTSRSTVNDPKLILRSSAAFSIKVR